MYRIKQFENAQQPQKIRTSLQALQDSDHNVRWSAASTLAKLGSCQIPGEQKTQIIQALIEALQDQNSDTDVRQEAAYALGNWSETQLSDAQKAQIFAALLRAHEDSQKNVRLAAVDAQAKLFPSSSTDAQKSQIITAIIETLQDSNQFVRSVTAKILENLSEVQLSNAHKTQIIEALLNFKSDDEKFNLLTTQILGKWLGKTLPKRLDEKIKDRLRYLAKYNKSQKVRELAQQCLESVERSQAGTKEPCSLPAVATNIASPVEACDLQSSMAMPHDREDFDGLEGGASKDIVPYK